MGWVDELTGQRVGLDSAPLIYYLEEDPTYLKVVAPFFEAITARTITAVTSTVTLVEVLTKPFREGRTDLAQRYRELLLTRAGISIQSVSPAIAEEAARLRATHGLRTPDALQLATASIAGTRTFLTNDTRLARVPGFNVLLLDTLGGGNHTGA